MASIVLAYLATWQPCDLQRIPVEKLTHLCYAFAKVQDGEIVPQGSSDPSMSNEAYCQHLSEQLRQLKQRNPDLQLLISVGGWSADGFSDAAVSPESRDKLARSAIEFIQKYQFDGVDLDWEYPSNDMAGIKARAADKQNFTLLLKALRQQLNSAAQRLQRASYLLTIAAGAGQYYLDGVEIQKVAEQCDFINLMTYDFYNGWATRAGHHANLYRASHDPDADSADHAVQLYLANGIRPEQLVLGCPFYGRSLRGVGATGLGAAGQPKTNGTYSYLEIVTELLPSGRYTRHWDDQARVPWLFDGDEFISYEDPESIAGKGEYVKQHGLAGAMFWEYTEDPSHALLDALYLSLQNEM
ncbi:MULTISPECIES: glycoside hydrolase family 18 protein [Deefgea]|uniref:chitinase n=1 Tax=Deefgea chitinilytica TaxID=570276 RepID=A0ABS2CFD1_9NEIS|nr:MULTISPECIES: glycoside hydrolase family 18 protein [Deefgea]MBM5572864.1 chitinase [Deefgea chitinilytica]MBM9890101.1 glycoside hydrolase family 18 protein [Deefgea sp. CFH1-16]